MGRDQMNQPPPASESDSHRGESAGTQTAAATAQSVSAKRSRWRELVFAAVAFILILGLAELLLRLTGFRFVPVPILTISTWGPDQLKAMNEGLGVGIFRQDDLLFWSMTPGVKLDIRQVNELGLLNGPIEVPKPAGVYRVLCLGDSCTALGPVAYPMVVQRRLDLVGRPDRRFEVINAGVFSYTSHQGLRLFRGRLSNVQPNLVTIYYGWNDHYLTAGYPDNLLQSREKPAPLAVQLLRHLRLYQLVRRAIHGFQMRRIGEFRVRAAPEDYRENVRAIVDVANERGARTILLTAPSNHAPGRVPEFFIKNRMAESEEALIVRHRAYNKIVREIAARRKVELLDLEALFNERNKDELFLQDGVHPNARGRRLIAQALVKRLGEMGAISADDLRRITERKTYDSTDPNVLRSRIEILGAPLRATVGQPVEIAARITNTGDTVWLARTDVGYGRVRFGTIVAETPDRRLGEKESGLLARDVQPGESVELRWTLSPFKKPGNYILEVGGVAEYLSWFREAGDGRTTTSLTIEQTTP